MQPTPPARIRPATVLDAAGLARVAGGTAAGWEERLAEPGARATWVAGRAGEVVGVAVASAAGAGAVRSLELEVLRLAGTETDPGTREHLLELAVGDAPCLVWVPTADADAQAFYARHGFAADGARRGDGGAVTGAADGAVTGAEIRMVR